LGTVAVGDGCVVVVGVCVAVDCGVGVAGTRLGVAVGEACGVSVAVVVGVAVAVLAGAVAVGSGVSVPLAV
jgi:hypothetical protein